MPTLALIPTRVLAVTLLALGLAPGVAVACAIDNTASLSANGVRATLNTVATPTNGAPYAPFTFGKAFASGAPVRIAEATGELARTLPPATIAAPFRWTFGDGAAALGRTATHRYARPGLYRLDVDGLDTRTKRWFTFDRALLRVVPPGQALQDNLGYYALRALDVAMSSLLWIFDAALVLLVLFVVARRARGRRSA